CDRGKWCGIIGVSGYLFGALLVRVGSLGLQLHFCAATIAPVSSHWRFSLLVHLVTWRVLNLWNGIHKGRHFFSNAVLFTTFIPKMKHMRAGPGPQMGTSGRHGSL